jgi:hypothetical protein
MTWIYVAVVVCDDFVSMTCKLRRALVVLERLSLGEWGCKNIEILRRFVERWWGGVMVATYDAVSEIIK